MREETPASTPEQTPSRLPKRLSVPLDFRALSIVLGLVIIVMLAMWKPWQPAVDANTRTIKVTGETTLKAEPDEYVFRPTYQNTSNDKSTAIKGAQDNEASIVSGLKKLNVKDSQIKTNIDGYENKRSLILSPGGTTPPSGGPEGDYVYTLTITVTLSSRAQAQQVQDYLTSTVPLGPVSPTPQFSETKRKALEKKARDEATRDARAKADQSARNLGFSVRGVKNVTDGTGFGVMPYAVGAGAADMKAEGQAGAPNPTFNVQPGEQDYAYSVSVEYYIK